MPIPTELIGSRPMPTVMLAVLFRHGATMSERRGRWVPANFGSVSAEAAVCRSGVGLAERSDRAMLEVRGSRGEVDRALGELASLGDRAWWLRVSEHRAIVRSEAAGEDACVAAMRCSDDVAIVDIAPVHTALTLVGPHAEAVLRAADVEDEGVAFVARKDAACVELLACRSLGPALWYRLLEAGRELGIACVGVDAIDQVDHLAAKRPD